MEEEIKKLWDRIVTIEQRLDRAPKHVQAAVAGDLQTLVGELKTHGIHSSLYVAPPEYVYGAEGQDGAWTENGDGTQYPAGQ